MGLPSYSVAIRTLGKAGKIFEQEIASLLKQTHLPEKIYAYIPDGYPIPEFENSQALTWIRSPKGMVTQRSLPFDEIMTDYILFLDDDVYLPEDGVEKLFKGLIENGGDCIWPNVFPNHKEAALQKMINYFYGERQFHDQTRGFIIRKSGYYSYNSHPPKAVMEAQTGSGPCTLCKKEVYKAIHFDDERWLEMCNYCLGEDQLFHYKMHIMGYKVLTHYDSGIEHLDAATTGRNEHRKIHRKICGIRYILWRRTSLELARPGLDRLSRKTAFYGIQATSLIGDCIKALCRRKLFYVTDRIRGIRDGIAFTKTAAYRSIPKFDAYKR